VFTHTETLDAFKGIGVATRLARAVLDAARARGLRVVARCPFVANYIDEHPEYQDLVA
jgi:predicted GNAT family acetyltransferase